MKETWNEKYNTGDYIFGKEPNEFFKEKIENIAPGKVLFIAEGEGRNSVYAAKLGWKVDAIDFSSIGKEKALVLASENKVKINYTLGDAINYNYTANYYDLIVIINFHTDENIRKSFHTKMIDSLKVGGKIILQVFEKEQIKMDSGGPPNLDLLYSLEDIIESFIDFDFDYFDKNYALRNINGKNKKAAVIRFFASKK